MNPKSNNMDQYEYPDIGVEVASEAILESSGEAAGEVL